MTKHQYLHLTNEIAKLHSDMKLDFVLVIVIVGLSAIIGMLARD